MSNQPTQPLAKLTEEPEDLRMRLREVALIMGREVSSEWPGPMSFWIGSLRDLSPSQINQALLTIVREDLAISPKSILDVHNRVRHRMLVSFVIDTAARVLDLDRNMILSDRRDREAAWPRQIVMSLARKYTNQTVTQIGRILNRDHSTVCFAISTCEERLRSDPEFAHIYGKVEQALLSWINTKTHGVAA